MSAIPTTEGRPVAGAVAEIPLSEITTAEGHNPRTNFDPAKLEELSRSIANNGVVQAITVRPNATGDGYVIVAGERRFLAAQMAELESIPALIRDGNGDLAAAVAENLTRQDLDVVEEARALDRLAGLEGLNQKELAERIAKSPAYVADRLRLLKLPEGCHTAFASGELPLAAEKPLRDVARISPDVAVALVAYATGDDRGSELVRDLPSLLHGLAGAIEDGRVEDPPTLIPLGFRGLSTELLPDDEQQAAVEEYMAARKVLGYGHYGPGEAGGVQVKISDGTFAEANAAGVVLTLESDEEWRRDDHFLVDREWAADIVRREIEATIAEAVAHHQQRAAEAEERGETPPADPSDPGAVADQQAEQRRLEREERAKARQKAERHNERVGVALLKRRGGETRKKHSLNRAKAVARVLIADNPNLAGRGLRYVLPQLREVETKTLKSGEERHKTVLASPERCREYLLERIAEAKSPQEVLELLADALIAAETADQAEVAGSNRVQFYNHELHAIYDEFLSADAKEVKIKRPPVS